jgi:hypothetical protein
MKYTSSNFLLFTLLAIIVFNCQEKQSTENEQQVSNAEILPSWNEGEAKQSIISFVKTVTDSTNSSFVPEADRIAVFDNDGTLWSEQPFYFQVFFAIDRVKALAPEHPEWKNKQPFKAAIEGDMDTLFSGGMPAIIQLIMVSHTGMTTEAFEQTVLDWIKTAKHPKNQRLFTDLAYKPMIEVLNYLRLHGFKTYIVSGGGIDFMRPWAEQVYGIPKEQIIGSSIKTKFEMQNGQPVIVRLPELEFIDDGEGKPVGINRFIGKKPIAVFGNSDGDLQMLQWCTSGKGTRLGVVIHHTDSVREVAYDRASHIGHLDKALDEAAAKRWTVVSMKDDWNNIYAFE